MVMVGSKQKRSGRVLMVMKTAVVLGAGPAGLLATHALVSARVFGEVRIISRGEKSTMYGAQYLHEPIPNVPGIPSIVVNQMLNGTGESYARKVYGDLFDPMLPNSSEQYNGKRVAWDIRTAYDRLWERYGDRIEECDLSDKRNVYDVMQTLQDANVSVFNTVPRNLLCRHEHQFKSMDIWAAGDAPEAGSTVPFSCDNETIVCNGLDNPAWYRVSRIFGRTTIEWPGDRRPPIGGVTKVSKPISTNCDCWPLVRHYGRYGRWTKGVLAHTAFFEVRSYVEQMAQQGILF